MSSYTIPSVIERTSHGAERSADVFSRLLSDRIVYLGTPVDDGVANTVIAQILHLENDAPDRPIQLYLNSEGGDAQAVLAIHDALEYVRSDVAVTCVGQVVAAPVVLLAAGTPGMRAVLPHARVVLHPLEASGRGAVPDLILATQEVERVRRELESVIAEHSAKDLATVRADLERERVLDAQAAVDYGLADRVLRRR
ncbi:ATP-dependent Clp protease proteolytic subunit [Brachybacterium halotolerans subsp. kimchii]|uniref:ATP-dependent Clp protease proteolytic subunit n=1 Tax=Brachybacterium halotolerans TaxID=2795215 RepID=A0ABS1B6G6_9MICO|nr:ATP-dependent Clp protease proteolytic subunit [Brachybacterium halotolerans]MBK0330238.1 ATP-dependent Clp protease proteolytic subunit [Brachybacterium halotolerans]MCG7308518.1 ATP-dependent Clp protease proteolytic subunit [Brachybacterium sp. ACRRE]UEJ83009.1 ATP-dependent Clp protease proteolytic subunit [Brachybacterium halotolerans subsp. kimchii]